MQRIHRKKTCVQFALFTARMISIPLFFLSPLTAFAIELGGNIILEGRYFSEEPKYTAQQENNASVVLEPELYHTFDYGAIFHL